MNMENYDQVTVQPDVVGDQAAYLQPEMKVSSACRRHRDRDRVAAEGDFGSHRDRADHQGPDRLVVLQAGVLSNGVRTAVPPLFAGTRVVVMTADGTYVERAKDWGTSS